MASCMDGMVTKTFMKSDCCASGGGEEVEKVKILGRLNLELDLNGRKRKK